MSSVTSAPVGHKNRSRLGRAACVYGEMGLAVLPLSAGTKIPYTTHGVHDATTDRARIEQWWRLRPNSNIGMACGEASGGIFPLDIDPRNGGDDSLADLCRTHMIPETPRSLTGGGGEHIFFRGNARCTVIAPGVDIKGNGGYVVLPPSVHPNGKVYAWDALSRPDDIAFADAPAWLLKLCEVKPTRAYYNHTASIVPRSFVLGAAFDEAGWLGDEIRPGVFAVLCPNRNEHSTGEDFDTSTVIFAPGPGGQRGHFHCSHEHCRGVMR